MGINFPNSPTLNQVYPAVATPPLGQYKWDGEKWTATGVAQSANVPLYVNGGQTIAGGFNFTAYNQAAGSFTINPLNGNYQWINNTAAFTITAPGSDCAVDILVINGAGAGAITFTGFTVSASVGDALTTVNGNRFIVSVRRINGIATYVIKALQ